MIIENKAEDKTTVTKVNKIDFIINLNITLFAFKLLILGINKPPEYNYSRGYFFRTQIT